MPKTTQKDLATTQDDFRELSRTLAELRDPAGVETFLRELCTPAECVGLAMRWRLVKELLSGKSQRTVARELGMSLCRITRGARYVRTPGSILAGRARESLNKEST